MNAVAFVPVRLSSSRLPKKHFRLIGDKPLLSWVIKRLRDCKEVDDIVVCAPLEKDSYELKEFCEKEGVKLYLHEGDVNDVVGRLTKAAVLFNADICVLASGDCPLLCSRTIDRLISFLRENPSWDMVSIKAKNGERPIHEGIMVCKRKVWELCDKFSDTPELREHQFPVLTVYPEKFSRLKFAEIEDEEIFYSVGHRISVDTPADLEFMNVVYEELRRKNRNFNLIEVVRLLNENPRLKEINAKVKRKGLKDKSYKVLILSSAVKEYGFGNLMRALEIADRLVNKGIGVRLAVLDEKAAEICRKRHFEGFVVRDWEDAIKFYEDYDLFIFDLNSSLSIPEKFVKFLKENGKKVVFIDNVKGGAEFADLIIVPTAHYVGKSFPNLIWGPEYVVIREEVLKYKENLQSGSGRKGGGGVLCRVDTDYEECVEKLWKNVNRINSFSDSFLSTLASSEIFVSHLGLSCYEAVFLDIPVVVIPRKSEEISEISKFYDFLVSEDRKKLGDGAKRIADRIEGLLNGDIS